MLIFQSLTSKIYFTALTYSRRSPYGKMRYSSAWETLTAVSSQVMSSPCIDIDNNKMLLACLAAYERLAYEGIRILALVFP